MLQLALTAASLATMAIGGIGSARAARQNAQLQQNVTRLEQQAEAQRFRAMELDARRRSLEVLRNQQRARAMSLSTAVGQGVALGSSVLGGAFGQIRGQTQTNLQGISENLDIGRNMFSINRQIGDQRIRMSEVGSTAATYSGISSLGGALFSSAQPISNLLASAPAAQPTGGTPFGVGSNTLGPR